MKADFSTWRFNPQDDHQGVLFQQGRLISDADLTDAEALARSWRLTAGRDIIGANIAAVPATEPDGYRVVSATVDGAEVQVGLNPGRIWADGLHTLLQGDPGTTVIRRADYLPEPHNPAGTGTASIGEGTRDAVILELQLEALNGFQDPARLIEPALGGPDTAARIIPHAALRLLRLNPGESCETIGPRIRDDLGAHGRLTVTLDPPTVVPGDCPVVEGGGYSGFEHNLYRIEIAETNAGPARFKWSQFNGGLVGRGTFHGGVNPHVDITANRSAILHSGLITFYLEAVAFDDERGHWRVIYGTLATLNSDDELDLTQPATFGTLPGAGTPVFFRLWNGIREIGDFINAANPEELRDGIRLAFDAPIGATYRPGSWWNFDVRAGEIANPEMLVDDSPPEGPAIRRVPLAEVTYTAAGEAGEIEDCRRRFRPLTNQKLCCTYIVGNGLTTFGDFNSLEEAAAHLPPTGGKLCLLPGIHFANLELVNRRRVHISGCRHRTFVLPRLNSVDQPIIRVAGGQDIAITEVDFVAPFGIAIDVEGSAQTPLRGVLIEGCRIMALTHGIHVETAADVRILKNQIWLLDHPRGVSTISIRATDALIEKNRTGVWPFEFKPPGGDDEPGDEPPDPADPCIEPDELFGNLQAIIGYVTTVWAGGFSAPPTQPYRARGGIHVKGSSERIDIRRNRIDGGLGHGITLGGVFPDGNDVPADDDEADSGILLNPEVSVIQSEFFAMVLDDAGTSRPGVTLSLANPGGEIVAARVTDENGEINMKAESGTYDLAVDPGLAISKIDTVNFGSNKVHIITVILSAAAVSNPDAGFLTRIRIIENQIGQMGLSGIGFWFYDLVPDTGLSPANLGMEALAGFVSRVFAPKELIGTTNLVRDLVIRGNRIEGNLQAAFTDLLRRTALFVAQGGISLAMAEGLRIERNHITGNGVSGENPCTGIFVGYGEEIQISGNYISGNGPVHERYRELRSDGFRGGIFIRLAASVVAGATGDGIQKPALLIRDNVIDQPAGRAITALAYGPVSVVGNTLNAEYEGAWSVIDDLVGGVLILNLGGIHRFSKVASSASQSFIGLGDMRNMEVAANAERAKLSRYQRRVEAMLPGGETLVNSNRVRTGPENRSWTSQVIVTADDLGFDGNQSGTYRPDITFCNTIALAHSLRMTDNRFRERAPLTAMSALTVTGGATLSSGASAMNMTTQNQGDHCIVAMSAGAVPVEDRPNQVVHFQNCPGRAGANMAKDDYVKAAFLLAWRFSVMPDFQTSEGKAGAEFLLQHSIGQIEQFQMQSYLGYAREAERYKAIHGAGNANSIALADAALVRREKAEALLVQRELAEVKEVALPDEGLLLDGRVADLSGRAAKGQIVEAGYRGRPTARHSGQDKQGGILCLGN